MALDQTPNKRSYIQVPNSSPERHPESSPLPPKPLIFGAGGIGGSTALKEKLSFNGKNLLDNATRSHVSMKKDLEILQGLFPSISENMIKVVYVDKTSKDLKMAKRMLTAVVEKRKQKEVLLKQEQQKAATKKPTISSSSSSVSSSSITALQVKPEAVIKKRKIATVKLADDEDEVMVISSPEQNSRSHFRNASEVSPQKQSSKVVLEKNKSITQKYSVFQRKAKEIEEETPEPKAETVKKRKLVRGSRSEELLIVEDNEPEEIVVLSDDEERENEEELQENDDFSDDSDVEDTEDKDESALHQQVLDFFNTTEAREIVDLCQVSFDVATAVVASRPFRSINHFESLNFSKSEKRRKKTDGETMSYKAFNMLKGYNAVDSLVEKCSKYSESIAQEINKWGVTVHGVNDELEIIDIPEDSEEDDLVKGGRKQKSTYIKEKPSLLADGVTLKNYQQVGLNWLYLLYRKNLSCILADEMGLGKTCQVIAFISLLKQNDIKGPHLVVVPSSTLENWMREFQKFAPELQVEPYYGSQADREDQRRALSKRMAKIDVIVTTYNLATSSKDDHSFLKHAGFNVIIYDEGHMLKNSASDRFVKLMKLRANFRLLLTGTPLQNNLKELMSLLEFILPEVFVSKKEELSTIFSYRASIKNDSNHNPLLAERAITKARKMMAPFILRRKKDQVLQHLPPKFSTIEMCQMTKDQAARYEKEIEIGIEHKANTNKKAGRNTIMYLRKASIHPLLFRGIYTNSILREMSEQIMQEDAYRNADRQFIYEDMEVMTDFELNRLCTQFPSSIGKYQLKDSDILNSGKFVKLKEILDKVVVHEGKKILVFSQFTQVLDILESALSIWDLKFLRLDGSTPVEIRHDIIDKFYDDDQVNVFLLSTKAGGFGINLVCANNVVIFDQSFNPHDDRQAEDRAHRVGQTQPVNVIRLISEDTIDENIYSLTLAKLQLDSTISGEAVEEDVEKNLLEGDFKRVFKIDANELKPHLIEESRDVSLAPQEQKGRVKAEEVIEIDD